MLLLDGAGLLFGQLRVVLLRRLRLLLHPTLCRLILIFLCLSSCLCLFFFSFLCCDCFRSLFFRRFLLMLDLGLLRALAFVAAVAAVAAAAAIALTLVGRSVTRERSAKVRLAQVSELLLHLLCNLCTGATLDIQAERPYLEVIVPFAIAILFDIVKHLPTVALPVVDSNGPVIPLFMLGGLVDPVIDHQLFQPSIHAQLPRVFVLPEELLGIGAELGISGDWPCAVHAT